MRPSRALVATALVSGLTAAACGGSAVPELQPGELAGARLADEPERPTSETWVVTLELDDRSVNGQDLVVVEVPDAAVSCTSGAAAGTAALPAGTPAQVERADRREVDRAHPPLVTGRRLVLPC